ncbi:phosphoglycerate kinase [Candidatus Gracilibacteria bacterium]|nr:phosphoglycerate kinase [Candidatus Gracilibacteria bacterium]MCF7819446.1 phosphoglycerate kinase [Candidatus Gracilibacteria bacterium]
MNFHKLTPEAIKNKVVLVRVDFNVPLKDGKIQEVTRIAESIPTIRFLLENGAKRIHLLTHIGRPKGENVPNLSTKLLIHEVSQQIGEEIEYREAFAAGENRIQLHENVRFWKEEKKNDPAFAQKILDGTGAEVFVNDGFAVSHRAHASVVGFAGKIPCLAGFLLQKEIEALSPFLSEEKVPGLVVLAGGLKIETKIPVLTHFAVTAEHILTGGGVANNFAIAQGYNIGESFYQEEFVRNARRILKIANQNGTGIHLPIDVVCADDPESVNTADFPLEDVIGSAKIFDIGIHTIASYIEILSHAKIVVWNGPVGLFEKEKFERGTKKLLEFLSQHKNAKVILGGGDTLEALKKFHIPKESFAHVSTGGGAMLEFLEGKELPGIEIVRKK